MELNWGDKTIGLFCKNNCFLLFAIAFHQQILSWIPADIEFLKRSKQSYLWVAHQVGKIPLWSTQFQGNENSHFRVGHPKPAYNYRS